VLITYHPAWKLSINQQSSIILERLPYLDGWRGVAILLVLIGHFCPVQGMNLGALGVELFFVLSGRLMAEILFVQKIPIKQFYKHRLSRTYPGLLAFVIITFFALYNTKMQFGIQSVLASLTFTFNYYPVMPEFSRPAVLQHLWSLCVEEHSYLILGAIAYWQRKKAFSPAPIIGAIAVLSMLDGAVSMYVFNISYIDTYYRTDAHMSSIFIACALYLKRGNSSREWLPSLAMGVFFSSFIMFLGPFQHTCGTLLLAYTVCNLEHAPTMIIKFLSGRILRFIGLISYSLYLWQQLFFKFDITTHHQHPWALLVLAVISGLAGFYIIERPSRKWLNKHWN